MSVASYTNMTEAIQELRKRGFTANFEFLDQEFRDVDSEKIYTADELSIVEHYRFEGASDPEDMSVVYAIESHDGTRGSSRMPLEPTPIPNSAGFSTMYSFEKINEPRRMRKRTVSTSS